MYQSVSSPYFSLPRFGHVEAAGRRLIVVIIAGIDVVDIGGGVNDAMIFNSLGSDDDFAVTASRPATAEQVYSRSSGNQCQSRLAPMVVGQCCHSYASSQGCP